MSSSKLDQLRATLASLESYDLPDKFAQDPVDQVLSEDVIERYQKARDDYIHRRMLQVFYDHVGTLDENGEFDLPPMPTELETLDVQQQRTHVQETLLRTAAQVNQSNAALQAKYSAFCARRDELRTMIHEMEQNPMSQDDDEDSMDEDVDQEEFTYQGQHLADVTQRKVELEVELQRIRQEKALALQTLEDTKKEVEDLQKQRGAVVRTVSPETLQELESETTSIRNKVAELKEMSEWYGGICEVMEEIGGIKILSVQDDSDDDKVAVKVQVLGKHDLQVELTSRGNAFHVTGATFLTSTLVRSQGDADSSVQLNIPPLDDLVRLSANLGSVEDLRFLLRESMTRIRTITARVNELAVLRTRYLTKIGKLHYHDYSFGGEDQEIVCSLNEGITAIIRLAPDCPMIDGSARLDQIVGVGGWDKDLLERIEANVKACKGPLAIMENLVEEIRRVEGLPQTPNMPSRKAN